MSVNVHTDYLRWDELLDLFRWNLSEICEGASNTFKQYHTSDVILLLYRSFIRNYYRLNDNSDTISRNNICSMNKPFGLDSQLTVICVPLNVQQWNRLLFLFSLSYNKLSYFKSEDIFNKTISFAMFADDEQHLCIVTSTLVLEPEVYMENSMKW